MSLKQDTAWLLREKYAGEKSEGFFADSERLNSGEPLAYVIGWQPFLDTRIYLDSKPLIPRPETEYWTKKAIERIAETKPNARVLDLCAGSGAIGVAVAKALPTARVDFAEIDAGHHSTISKNIAENGIDTERTNIFIGDVCASVPHDTKYDYILSNPPYIDRALDRTEKSVKEHEPFLALYGGTDGFETIKRILRDAGEYFTPTSELWIEHEPEQSDAIASLARDLGYRTCETMRDQFDVLRYSIVGDKVDI
jgi:release factor glutamine methyltransferase